MGKVANYQRKQEIVAEKKTRKDSFANHRCLVRDSSGATPFCKSATDDYSLLGMKRLGALPSPCLCRKSFRARRSELRIEIIFERLFKNQLTRFGISLVSRNQQDFGDSNVNRIGEI